MTRHSRSPCSTQRISSDSPGCGHRELLIMERGRSRSHSPRRTGTSRSRTPSRFHRDRSRGRPHSQARPTERKWRGSRTPSNPGPPPEPRTPCKSAGPCRTRHLCRRHRNSSRRRSKYHRSGRNLSANGTSHPGTRTLQSTSRHRSRSQKRAPTAGTYPGSRTPNSRPRRSRPHPARNPDAGSGRSALALALYDSRAASTPKYSHHTRGTNPSHTRRSTPKPSNPSPIYTASAPTRMGLGCMSTHQRHRYR